MSDAAMNFNQFLLWERSSRDSIDLKKTYIDMAGDLIAGLLLSQIVYWYLPGKDGQSKLRVQHEDKEWIAKPRYEWWDEIRITPKQFDRAVNVLEEAGIVETARFKFNNSPTKHLRIVQGKFLELWQSAIETVPENPFLPKGEKRAFLPKGEIQFSPYVKILVFTKWLKTLTETTQETTSKNTLIYDVEQALVKAFDYVEADMGKSEKSMLFAVAKDLTNRDNPVLPEEVPDLFEYVKKVSRAEGWSLTPNSLKTRVAKWRKTQRPLGQGTPPETMPSTTPENNDPFDPANLPEDMQNALTAWLDKMDERRPRGERIPERKTA